MKKRILSMILTIIMITVSIPTNIFAASPVHILALGDSITAGYGLKDPQNECFTALLGDNYIVTNKAVSGNTTAGVLKQLKNGTIDAQMITSADVITITIGGNDIMAFLYEKTMFRPSG